MTKIRVQGSSFGFLVVLEEPVMSLTTHSTREPWNKGKLVGQKAPLKLKDSGPFVFR
jgi:hypothetical protein